MNSVCNCSSLSAYYTTCELAGHLNVWLMGPWSYTMHPCSLVPASYHKVVTTQVLHKAIHIDQKYIRAIHYCGGPCAHPIVSGTDSRACEEDRFQCSAVHFGLCTQAQHPTRRAAPAVRRRHSSRAYNRLSSKIRSKVYICIHWLYANMSLHNCLLKHSQFIIQTIKSGFH